MNELDIPPPDAVAARWTLPSWQAARIIFGNDLYIEYTKWQHSTNKNLMAYHVRFCPTGRRSTSMPKASGLMSVGDLPTRPQFKAFMNFAMQRNLLYESTRERPEPAKKGIKAQICSHTFHPACPPVQTFVCAVCLATFCAQTLNRICEVFTLMGGPRAIGHCENGTVYGKVRSMLRYAKVQWLKMVYHCQRNARIEIAWEEEQRKKNPSGLDVAVKHTISSIEALRILGACPAMGDDVILANFASLTGERRAITSLGMHMQDVSPEPTAASISSAPPDLPNEQSLPSLPNDESSVLVSKHMLSTEEAYEESAPVPASGRAFPLSPTDEGYKQSSRAPISQQSILDSPTNKAKNQSSPALGMSRSFTSQYPIDEPQDSSNTPLGFAIKTSKKKQVNYACEVPIEQNSRRLKHFSRKSRFYLPGRFACPSEDGWQDTSFMHDKSFILVRNDAIYHSSECEAAYEADDEQESSWVQTSAGRCRSRDEFEADLSSKFMTDRPRSQVIRRRIK